MKRGMDASVYIIWKKCFAFLMAAVLVLTSVDVTVFAAGTEEDEIIIVDEESDFGHISFNDYRKVSAGKYRLANDIELTSPLQIERGVVTILFDGYTLKKTGSSSVIWNTGYLTLGGPDDKNGTITGANGNNGGGIYNSYSGGEPPILINYVTISGNSANYGGGVCNTGTFTNYGDICNNTASREGGGVYNTGTFINYGKICNNTATNRGGGVYNYNKTSAKFQISGTAIVKENTSGAEGEKKEDNVALIADPYGKNTVPKITITGSLNSDSSIGVNMGSRYTNYNSKTQGVVTEGYRTYVGGEDLKYFFLDEVQEKDYLTGIKDGEVKIIEHYHSWKSSFSANTISAYCNASDQGSLYCPYKNSGNKKVELSLQADNADYSGEPYSEAKLDGEEAFVRTTKATVEEISYEGRDDTTYESSETPPTAVGSYTAKVTVTIKGASYELTKDFAISKKIPTARVVMSDYTFGENPSTPSLEEGSDYDKKNSEVTYYYNTSNSNSGGTKWENIDGESLDPGTYYMYAVFPETDYYKTYTTEPVEFKVSAANMSGDVSAEDVNETYNGGGI